MNDQLLRHLNISADLVVEFMAVFSRFEYALKSTDFADGGPARVDPAWDRFANHIHEQLIAANDKSLNKARIYLLEEPPRKQVLIDGELKFSDQTIDTNQCSTQQLLKMVRTIRNNLFHGGKYCPDGEIEAGRNQRLIEASLEVLSNCCHLHDKVSASYER